MEMSDLYTVGVRFRFCLWVRRWCRNTRCSHSTYIISQSFTTRRSKPSGTGSYWYWSSIRQLSRRTWPLSCSTMRTAFERFVLLAADSSVSVIQWIHDLIFSASVAVTISPCIHRIVQTSALWIISKYEINDDGNHGIPKSITVVENVRWNYLFHTETRVSFVMRTFQKMNEWIQYTMT